MRILLTPPENEDVLVDGASVPREAWDFLIRGRPLMVAEPDALNAALRDVRVGSRRREEALARRFGVNESDIWKAYRASLEEPEKRAGRKLGVDAIEVGFAAIGLWGHSLGEERERILGTPDRTRTTSEPRADT